MTKHQHSLVGLDSQCLSYLLDAISSVTEPTDALASEKKALIRIWFYTPITYYTSETVVSEATAIQEPVRRELHTSSLRVLFLDPPVQDREKVEARTTQLSASHQKLNDCRIVAEAEDLQLDILLTYDRRLLKRLGLLCKKMRIMRPRSFWSSLDIPYGADLVNMPHVTNPLRTQTWWRWDCG